MNTKSYNRSIVIALFAIGLLLFAVSPPPENAQAASSLSVVQPASAAANVIVGGIVINMVTNNPASGVTIRLYFGTFGGSPNYTTTSDENGGFMFSNIPSGTYAIFALPPTGYIGSGMGITVGSVNISFLQLTLIQDVSLLSPANNAIVEDPKPYLCWEAMPQAISYRLQLNRKSDWLLIANPQVSSSCYQVTETLENNVNYSWSLANVLNAQGQSIGGSGSFTFTYKTGPVSQTVSSATSTNLPSLDGTIMAHFPIGAFSGTGTVTYQRDSVPVMTQSLVDIQKTYEISSTVPLAHGVTYSVTITFNPSEIPTIKPDSLALYYWDDIQNQWVKEPTSSLDETNHRVTASPNHLSKWAVLGETSRIFLPIIIK